MTVIRLAIGLFVIVAALGPLYTAPGYSAWSQVISELAGQNTPRNYLMSGAFLVLGAAVVFEGLRHFHRAWLPFMAFGLFFGLAGVFGHKPFTPGVHYVAWVDATHSALATLSGISLTCGFVWHAVRVRSSRQRAIAWVLAAVCVGFPLIMLSVPAYQGVFQRIMYLSLFAWLWVFYPSSIPD